MDHYASFDDSDSSELPVLEDINVKDEDKVLYGSTLMYTEEVVQYCEYEQAGYTSYRSLGNCQVAKTCYQPKVEYSRYCYNHKCKSCDDACARKSNYCMNCSCPVVGCTINAYACGNRCSCCDSYHRPNDEEKRQWCTCESCTCSVCASGPIVQRHGVWGDVLLCADHAICVVFECEYACDIDNPRYCPQHKHSICKQLKALELSLYRINKSQKFTAPRDIRLMICRRYQWAIENQLSCTICKTFYKPELNEKYCASCAKVKEQGMREIGGDILIQFWSNAK